MNSEILQRKIVNFLTIIYFKIFPLRIMRYHLYRIETFIKSIAKKHDISKRKMLDIGAQNSPYKKYFTKLDYYSQDIEQNSNGSIDFVGDINEGLDMIKDNSFDYILCTQVLEHIREPKKAFQEFYRILKPNGKIFLTTHLCFEEHMIPFDYFRFTKYGLRYLGESNGFIVEYISPQGGIFQVIALIFDTLLIKLFFKRGFLYYFYVVVFTVPIFIFNTFCYLLDFLDRDKIMTLNYECIYKKK
ncbi:MAG: methyltransferase domain-containing protein [Patescibacteria group bacterium]